MQITADASGLRHNLRHKICTVISTSLQACGWSFRTRFPPRSGVAASRSAPVVSLDRHVKLSFRVILSHSRWTNSTRSGHQDRRGVLLQVIAERAERATLIDARVRSRNSIPSANRSSTMWGHRQVKYKSWLWMNCLMSAYSDLKRPEGEHWQEIKP